MNFRITERGPTGWAGEALNQAARRNLTDDQRAACADEVAEDEEELSKQERAKKANDAKYGRSSLHTDVVCEESSLGSLTADQKAIIASDAAPEQTRKKAARKEWAVPKAAGVSERTVRDWLSRIDKDAREARNKRIFNL